MGRLSELLKLKREEILKIAATRGAINIRIFGSVARDSADEKSDIDFLVELEPGRSLFDLGGLLMDLQSVLGCPVDVVTEKGLKKRIRERILDIKEAIEQIEKYSNQGKEAYEDNELIQTWVLHYLQIIGETTRAISLEFKSNYPSIPWTEIIGMRNILVHEYSDIDYELVWQVIEHDLPSLKKHVQNMLNS